MLRARDLTFLTIGLGFGAALVGIPSEVHAQGFGVAASGATTGVAAVAVGNSGNIAAISKWFTDVAHSLWGGDPAKHPPLWVLLTLPVMIGVGLTVLFCIASGVDLTQGPAMVAAFLSGLFSGGGGAHALTVTQNQAQLGAPTIQPPSAITQPAMDVGKAPPDVQAASVPDLSGATQVPLTPPPPASTAPAAPGSPQTGDSAPAAVVGGPNVLPSDQAQPLFNVDGVDIAPIFDPAWQAAGIPRVLLLAGVLAESGLDGRAERWGSRTPAARLCIATHDTAGLQTIIDAAGLDVSFGYSQRIVAYHWAGDHSMTVANCLAVRDAVFGNPGRDLMEMASMLRGCLDQARAGDLSPVGGDELLGALAVYNGGHLYPPGDPWWSDWAGNIASYKAMLDRIRKG